MSVNVNLKGARCGIVACRSEPGAKRIPPYCPMHTAESLLADVREVYADQSDDLDLLLAAARTEAAGYCRDTRVQEVMAFARRIGASHLGIACCIGLQREAALAQDIFEANGFRVSSVLCKVGSMPKESLGISKDEKVRPDEYEPICNPIAQARLLAEAGTELNVVIGLCVGHDSLFFRHSVAPATVLVAKDRVTGHNPAAALYTVHSYYRKLKET